MPHTKILGTGNKIKFVLLWIMSCIGRVLTVLTYAVSGNVVGGFGEFGDIV